MIPSIRPGMHNHGVSQYSAPLQYADQPPTTRRISPQATASNNKSGIWGGIKSYFKRIGLALIGQKSTDNHHRQIASQPIPHQSSVEPAQDKHSTSVDKEIANWPDEYNISDSEQNIPSELDQMIADSSLPTNTDNNAQAKQDYTTALQKLKQETAQQRALMSIIQQQSLNNLANPNNLNNNNGLDLFGLNNPNQPLG